MTTKYAYHNYGTAMCAMLRLSLAITSLIASTKLLDVDQS